MRISSLSRSLTSVYSRKLIVLTSVGDVLFGIFFVKDGVPIDEGASVVTLVVVVVVSVETIDIGFR